MIPERAEAAGGGEGGGGGGGGGDEIHTAGESGGFLFFFVVFLPVSDSLLSGVLLAPGEKTNKKTNKKNPRVPLPPALSPSPMRFYR